MGVPGPAQEGSRRPGPQSLPGAPGLPAGEARGRWWAVRGTGGQPRAPRWAPSRGAAWRPPTRAPGASGFCCVERHTRARVPRGDIHPFPGSRVAVTTAYFRVFSSSPKGDPISNSRPPPSPRGWACSRRPTSAASCVWPLSSAWGPQAHPRPQPPLFTAEGPAAAWSRPRAPTHTHTPAPPCLPRQRGARPGHVEQDEEQEQHEDHQAHPEGDGDGICWRGAGGGTSFSESPELPPAPHHGACRASASGCPGLPAPPTCPAAATCGQQARALSGVAVC